MTRDMAENTNVSSVFPYKLNSEPHQDKRVVNVRIYQQNRYMDTPETVTCCVIKYLCKTHRDVSTGKTYS